MAVDQAGRAPSTGSVLIRSAGAIILSTPALVLATVIVWVLLDVAIVWIYRAVWTSSDLISVDDLWKIDDAFRLGIGGTWDAIVARLDRALDDGLANARLIFFSVLALWAILTSFSQTYFSIAVARRAGDPLPSRSNLVHAARRAPRVLMAWAVVSGASYAVVIGAANLMERWAPWISIPVEVAIMYTVLFLLTRTSFVVGIAVSDDDLTLGVGWMQCIGRSWSEVRGRTVATMIRLLALTVLPTAALGGALQALALAEGLTGVGAGLAVATMLTIGAVITTVFSGAATALWVIERRLD